MLPAITLIFGIIFTKQRGQELLPKTAEKRSYLTDGQMSPPVLLGQSGKEMLWKLEKVGALLLIGHEGGLDQAGMRIRISRYLV